MTEENSLPDFEITNAGPLSKLVTESKINLFSDLVTYIQCLPYGRTSSPLELSTVIYEKKGTCSTKHALLKSVANEQSHNEIELWIGLYKMNASNTPGIGGALDKIKLNYIPEAHCYLKYISKRYDFTSDTSNVKRIENDIIKELQIEPMQIGAFKVDWHKKNLDEWRIENSIKATFDNLWDVREQCIFNLTEL